MSKQDITFGSAKHIAKFVQYAYSEIGRPLAISPGFKNEMGDHLRLIDPNSGTVFHVKFAHERFKTFSRFFPEKGSGEGESISTEVVKNLKDNDVIFFGNPNEILKIFVGDLKKFGVIRENEKFKDHTWSVGVEFCEKYF